MAFLKGAVVGALVVVPAVGATVWALALIGLGPQGLTFVWATRTAAIFSGLAAIFTAGGIGRLAAEASVTQKGGLLRAMWVGARTQAAAGAGLVVISSLPHGSLPQSAWAWIAVIAAGALTGFFTGAATGLACGAADPLGLVDVAALTKWPQEAIRKAATVVGWDDVEPAAAPPLTPPAQSTGDAGSVPVPVSVSDSAAITRRVSDLEGSGLLRSPERAEAAPITPEVPTAGGPEPRHDVIIEATMQRRTLIDDETPLPRPLPLAETAPLLVPMLTGAPRGPDREERSDPTPLPEPMPLGETVPIRVPVRVPSEPGTKPGAEPREVREET